MKTLKRTMRWAAVGAFLLCSVAFAQTTQPENKAPEDAAKQATEPENKAPEDTAKQATEPEQQEQAPAPSGAHKAGWDVNDLGVPRKMDKWDICEHESHYVPSKPDDAAYKIQMDCMAGSRK